MKIKKEKTGRKKIKEKKTKKESWNEWNKEWTSGKKGKWTKRKRGKECLKDERMSNRKIE